MKEDRLIRAEKRIEELETSYNAAGKAFYKIIHFSAFSHEYPNRSAIASEWFRDHVREVTSADLPQVQ